VLSRALSDGEAPCGKAVQEGSARRLTEALAEQIVDFGDRRGGDDHLARLADEELEDLPAVWFGRIGECDERPGVDEQRHAPKPSSSSSSGISEIARGSASIRAKPAARANPRSQATAGSYAAFAA